MTEVFDVDMQLVARYLLQDEHVGGEGKRRYLPELQEVAG